MREVASGEGAGQNGRVWAVERLRARWGVQRPVAKLLNWPGAGEGALVVVEMTPARSQKTMS